MKYNIIYKEKKENKQIKFRSEKNMIAYLNNNLKHLNTLKSVYLNFKQIKLPLRQSVWRAK